MTSAKFYIYIGVGSRDLFIDEAHTALGIFPEFFPACCLLRFAAFFLYKLRVDGVGIGPFPRFGTFCLYCYPNCLYYVFRYPRMCSESPNIQALQFYPTHYLKPIILTTAPPSSKTPCWCSPRPCPPCPCPLTLSLPD